MAKELTEAEAARVLEAAGWLLYEPPDERVSIPKGRSGRVVFTADWFEERPGPAEWAVGDVETLSIEGRNFHTTVIDVNGHAPGGGVSVHLRELLSPHDPRWR
jgi:hypothetical protein